MVRMNRTPTLAALVLSAATLILAGCPEVGIKTIARTLAAPAAPTGVSAAPRGTTEIRVSWTDASDNETEFRVERTASADLTGWTLVGAPAENASSFDDSGLTANTRYFYRVRAQNEAGDSAWSTVVDATTLAVEVHATLTVTAGTGGSASPQGDTDVIEGVATTIVATPSTGYRFTGWSVPSGTGAAFADAAAETTTVTLESGNATILASFELKTYSLTVSSLPAGAGTLSPDTAGGPAAVQHGVATAISASAGTGYDFSGWTVTEGTGATFGNAGSATTSVTLTGGDASIAANFTLKEYSLTLTVSPAGAGTVSPGTATTVSHGAATEISATAGQGYVFSGWTVPSGNANIANPNSATTTATLTSGDATIQASFVAAQYTLTLTASPAGGGTISVGGSTVTSGTPTTVDHGTATDISATAGTGYVFTGWTTTSGNASIANTSAASTTATLTSGDATIQANFAAAWSYAPIYVSGTEDSGKGVALAIGPNASDEPRAFFTIGDNTTPHVSWSWLNAGAWNAPYYIDSNQINFTESTIGSIDGQGRETVAFTAGYAARLQRYAAGSWTTIFNLDPGGSFNESWNARGAIGYRADGTPVLACVYGSGMTSNPTKVAIANWAGTGAADTIRTAPSASYSMDIRLQVVNDTAHVVYREDNNYFYRQGTPGSWDSEFYVPVGGMGASAYDFVIDPASLTRYVFWIEGTDNRLYVSSSINGWTWTTPTQLGSSVLGAYGTLRAAIDSAGHPYCLYYGSSSGELSLAWFNGSQWKSEDILPIQTTNVETWISIVVGSDGFIHIAYRDMSNDLRYAKRYPVD